MLARVKTILVVDDERNSVELLRLYLEQEVVGATAATARRPSRLHRRHEPDLVVLD